MRYLCLLIVIILFFQTTLPGQLNDNSLTVIKAGAILNVGITSATSGGIIYAKNLADIKTTGLCWNTRPNPGLSDNFTVCPLDSASFICNMTNLFPDSLYFFRAFAVTDIDTIFSENKIFFTHRPDAVADADNNYYNTVNIGKQLWLQEDLKTTKFNDGSPITFARDNLRWIGSKLPLYCWYANDSVNYSFPRGKLYNWYAVGTGKLCPVGWHVPSNEEWMILENYLGGDSIAGGKLKTKGTLFWQNPNKKATNESGFTAFPVGHRNGSGDWFYPNFFDYWWSGDERSEWDSTSWYVYHGTSYLYHSPITKRFGYSVRCLKDQ